MLFRSLRGEFLTSDHHPPIIVDFSSHILIIHSMKKVNKVFLRVLSLLFLIILLAIGISLSVDYAKWHALPDLAKMPTYNFSDSEKGKEIFAERIKMRFPIGYPVNELLAELENQGFDISKEQGVAVYEISSFPCKNIWGIHWNDSMGKITDIVADYDVFCL